MAFQINPSNPWATISFGQSLFANAEQNLTSGILGGNVNPYTARQRLMQGILLSVEGRQEEDYNIMVTRADINRDGRFRNLALPADEPRLIAAA